MDNNARFLYIEEEEENGSRVAQMFSGAQLIHHSLVTECTHDKKIDAVTTLKCKKMKDVLGKPQHLSSKVRQTIGD